MGLQNAPTGMHPLPASHTATARGSELLPHQSVAGGYDLGERLVALHCPLFCKVFFKTFNSTQLEDGTLRPRVQMLVL